jgi:carbamoyltransferase
MKVLGINISHDSSIAEVVDGEVISFYEEARFKRIKHYSPADFVASHKFMFDSIQDKIEMDTVDKIVVTSFDRGVENASHISDEEIISIIKKECDGKEIVYEVNHHLHHAYCAKYFSKFDDALCIVLDGGGARMYGSHKKHQEIESVYHIDGWNISPKLRHLSDIRDNDLRKHQNTTWQNKPENVKIDGVDVKFSSEVSSGQKFATLCEVFGLGDGNSAGKVMGLAPYGEFDTYDNGEKVYSASSIAYDLQKETFKKTIEFIENSLKYGNTKNIIMSGGYALNCTNNYKYTEHFPDLNFFIDPNANDSGTAIGAALWGYYDNN